MGTDGKLVINEEQAEIVRRIYRMFEEGYLIQYFIENDHEAIIPKEEWLAVQLELERREKYREEIGIGNIGHGLGCFTGRVLCGHCNKVYGRKGPDRYGRHFWMCNNKMRSKGAACNCDNILETDLQKGFRIAWNSTVQDKTQQAHWDDMIDNGNPLERLRTKQMKLMAAEGSITAVVDEHVMLVLERIIVFDKSHLEVRFLDGTVKNVCIG